MINQYEDQISTGASWGDKQTGLSQFQDVFSIFLEVKEVHSAVQMIQNSRRQKKKACQADWLPSLQGIT